MTDRPILFSGPMVRALLDGRKTQTRRIFKPRGFEFYTHPISGNRFNEYRPYRDGSWDESRISGSGPMKAFGWGERLYAYLPCAPGDRLWVRETWQALTFGDFLPTKQEPCEIRFAATDPCADLDAEARGYPWRPSIFMPRWASRMTLTVTDVRVERLQDISGVDAIAEGAEITSEQTMTGPMIKVAPGTYLSPVAWYHRLWDEINGKGAWEANPWVVAYSFTVEHGNIDQIGRAAA